MAAGSGGSVLSAVSAANWSARRRQPYVKLGVDQEVLGNGGVHHPAGMAQLRVLGVELCR